MKTNTARVLSALSVLFVQTLIGLSSAHAAKIPEVSKQTDNCDTQLRGSSPSPPDLVYNRHPVKVIDPQVFLPEQISEFLEFFRTYGYVVLDQVSDKSNRDAVVARMDEIAEKIPEARRLGFMDYYHDDRLAELRQEPRLYGVFSQIFRNLKLWVVYDRVMYWNSGEGEQPLAPHVDQNPILNPDFFNVQGMLALRDMNETTGTVAFVSGSPHQFGDYAEWAAPKAGFVEYQGAADLPFVALRLREGQIVIWDSRTTHSRFRSPDHSATRYAALLTYTPASPDPELVALRNDYFQQGVGFNHHAAGLRATARPRYEKSLREQPERLTELGRRLYGIEEWPE